jgi:signal transduction histidine kinase
MVDSLLQLSRIQAGRALTERAPAAVGKLVAEIVEELRPEAESKELRLTFSDHTEQIVIDTDAGAVRAVLRNLLRNAVKFSLRGTIDVSASAAGGECRISIRDEGPGIPPHDQERIFEPFERVENVAHKHTSGFGLGLATAKRLSEALGGRIELSSAPGAGSVFTLVLIAENQAQAP